MKIGVIGLGLIGGSIFKNLQSKYDTVGVSRNVTGENISNDYSTLKNCNIVFVCTPMNTVLEILDKIEDIVKPETIVTDVCSLKEFVTKKDYAYTFIPSHPMAGTEHSGWEHSFPELFKNAKWVITPYNTRSDNSKEILIPIIESMGANAVIAKPREHDKAVALISHAPMVVAQALCYAIKDNELAKELASSGFRDTTRLALSNTEMANDMVNLNRKNILSAIDCYSESLNVILNTDYLSNAEKIKKLRYDMYN